MAKTTSRTTRKPAKTTTAKRAPKAQTLTPYLAVNDAKRAIEWYGKVFGTKTVGEAMRTPDGRIMHAALKLGDAQLFLSDIMPESDLRDATRSGTSVNLNVFHKDCDKFWERAVGNGAKVTMPIDDTFWGDRYGRIIDPFGHSWAISRKSKLSKKELEALRVKAMAQMAPQ